MDVICFKQTRFLYKYERESPEFTQGKPDQLTEEIPLR
jgi:hypothetical protein